MSTRIKDEARVLDTSEHEMVADSHHPRITELTPDELKNLLVRLRERRDRAQSLAARARRDARKSGGFDHANSGMRQKSGLLSEAVRRTNKEMARRRMAEKRDNLQANARRALDLKQTAKRPKRPSAGRTKDSGMNPVESGRTRKIGSSMEAGRVSQSVKDAQARRDSK